MAKRIATRQLRMDLARSERARYAASFTSPARAAAARENGKLGGRPRTRRRCISCDARTVRESSDGLCRRCASQ